MVGVGTFFCQLVKTLDRSKLQVESVRSYKSNWFCEVKVHP